MLTTRTPFEAYWALKQLNLDPATLAMDVTLVNGIDLNSSTFMQIGDEVKFTVPASHGASMLSAPITDVLASINAPADMSLKHLIMTLIDQAYPGR